MTFSFKPLREQVIVITGASSGIGLATAREAARQGARLALVSRNESVLKQIAAEIAESGGEAIPIVADVGQRADLQRAADIVQERFGGFDTWVNNAGVSVYGRLEEVRDEDHLRLFLTNFWGTVFGSLVALPVLRRRGGALINIGSEASDHALPLQGMYSASKHAVKGFTDALRMELILEKAPVSVTLIKPAGIDTPYTTHARNYLDEEPAVPPPVYAPEEVAHAILHAATHAKRDIHVGGSSRVMHTLARVAPGALDHVGAPLVAKLQTRDAPAQPRPDSLHVSHAAGRVRGDYPGRVMRRSLYTRTSLHPGLTGALVLGLGVVAYTLAHRRGAPTG